VYTIVNTMADTSFGDRLKELREQSGLSQNRLADNSGISREYINQVESGKRKAKPSMETVIALSEALGVDPSAFYSTGPARMNTKPLSTLWHEFQERYEGLEVIEVPIRGSIPAGTPFPKEQADDGTTEIPRIALGGVKNVEKLFAVRVEGHSLEGDDITDQDLAVVDPEAEFVDGKIYAVRLGSEVAARHVFREDGRVRLVSSSGKFQEITVQDLDILGRVILSGHWKKQ
jgi:SOS-response transcriptional repressor LexA